jgi:heme-degrading monooxygenase HmoA
MIRVVYRWTVEPDQQADFATWWHQGTLRIRSVMMGAKGSALFRPTNCDDELVAIARWESEEQLAAFWKDQGGSDFAGAVLKSVEILEELDDLTAER